MTGKRVEHRFYGKGVVKGERYLGNELLVEFQDGVGRWVQSRELIVSESDIIKSAILSFQKKHCLTSSVVRKDVIPQGIEKPQTVTPRTRPSENLALSNDPASHIHDTKELDSIIHDLLHKTDETDIPDKTNTNDIKPEPILSSDKILAVPYGKIIITEEPVSKSKSLLQKSSSLSESSIQEFTINKNHVLEISHPGKRKEINADTLLVAPDTVSAQIPGEAILVDIPTISDRSDQEISESITDDATFGIKDEIFAHSSLNATELKPLFSPYSADSFNARWVIEALRLGVVPHQKVEQFSCGRETESNQIDTWLNSDMGSLILSGEYGSGKSHMLDLTAAKGIQNNWAVASIEIDPNESPFNQPKKIYRTIISSFVFQDNDRLYGFREFILKVLYSENQKDLKKLSKHPYFGPLISFWLRNYKHQTDIFDEDFLNWIEGEEIKIISFPQMYSYQTAANIYCNILSGIGWAARNILGLQGLLILIDEGEGIDKGYYNNYQFDKAENFIKGLILTSDSVPDLIEEIDELKSSASLPGVKTGNLTGLRYCGQKVIVPYLWEEKSHIKIMFSFIPYIIPIVFEKIIQDDQICSRIPIIELEELSEDHLVELYDKIQRLYEVAYVFSSPNHIIDILPKDKTRLFVKSVVEALDIMRFNPSTYPEELNIQKTSAGFL